MALEMTFGLEAMGYNAKDGYLEAVVRGYKGGLLTAADYNNLSQCENTDDIKLHLSGTDYGNFLQNEQSPLHPSTIVEKCTERLVEQFQHVRAHASEPLGTFLDMVTYGHMIDNVVLIVTGTLHERDMHELIEKCHPLGMFDAMATLAVATSTRELYRLVIVDTPLAPYFSACVSSEDLDEMNVEVMRNALYKAYLEDFVRFCDTLGGTTAVLMRDILSFEADRRAITITVNSVGTELTRDDRKRLFCAFGELYPHGHTELLGCEDYDQVRAVVDAFPSYQAVFAKLGYGDTVLVDKLFYEEEARRCLQMFDQQFHYGVFYAYFHLREQEVRNLMWVAECVAQDQRLRVSDGVVLIL